MTDGSKGWGDMEREGQNFEVIVRACVCVCVYIYIF